MLAVVVGSAFRRRRPLVVKVLHAAGNSGNDRTLRALGQALGRVVLEPSQRARQELIVLALEGMTDEHIEVIAVISTDAQSTEEVVNLVAGRVDPDLVPMALAGMLPRGLFRNPYGRYGGGEAWELSTLGAAVRDAAMAAHPTRLED